MKQLTEILPDVFVLEVPADAQDFIVDMGYLIFKIMNMDGWITDDEIQEDAIRFLTTGKSKFSNLKEKSIWNTMGIPLPAGTWQYLGYCTKDETSKDVSESFRSLLLKHGFDSYEKLVVLKKVK